MLSTLLTTITLGAAATLASPVDLAQKRADSGFTYYDLSGLLTKAPCDLTTGPDGNIYADTFLSNKIVKIDRQVTPYKLKEYDIPYTLPLLNTTALPLLSQLQGTIAFACVVQPGKDGKVYAAAGVRNEFVVFDPATEKIEVYPTGNPLGNLQPFNDAWPGDTGMFFSQTTGNVINLFDYETHEIKTWQVPTPLAGPLGMKVAADGGLWFVETFATKIARLNATTGQIDEYNLPASLALPAVLRAETDDGNIYFTALLGNAIGSFNIYTHEIKVYTDPTLLATPVEDTTDAEGNVWYSTLTQNSLNKLDPKTGKVTRIQQPDAGLLPGILPSLPPAVDIAMHYDSVDNSMWFTEFANNRIGRYQL